MGASVQTGGRRRGGRHDRKRPMAEINVTPMVDVMLVLLIIFMVAAPMMTAGVPIDLPKTAASEINSQTQPITVAVTPEGAVFVGTEPVAESDLVAKVMALATNGTEDRIFLRGDTAANYGSVMRVMGLLSGAGFTKIGLITEKLPGTP